MNCIVQTKRLKIIMNYTLISGKILLAVIKIKSLNTSYSVLIFSNEDRN